MRAMARYALSPPSLAAESRTARIFVAIRTIAPSEAGTIDVSLALKGSSSTIKTGTPTKRSRRRPVFGGGKSTAEISDEPIATADKSLREIADDAARFAERRAVCSMLRSTAGNKSQAPKALRTDYKTLHVKMKHLGIRAKDFTP
jgi:DNA-binding NtrC family response regulator